jgi:uroporphyrin-III C-methyltransferase
MSTEIESLTTDMNTRRTGGGVSPMLVAFAVLGLLLALYAHWRFGQFDDRIDKMRRQIVQLRSAQDRIASTLTTLTTRVEQSDARVRDEIKALREIPAQVNELGQNVAELRTRADAPQRTWVRAEALYLLELADRRLQLEHDVPTAIVAMESADARLATVTDTDVAQVRLLLAAELKALRAVPVPNLPEVITRLTALESQTATLPVLGVPVSSARRLPQADPPKSGFDRALRRINQAIHDLFSLRRVQPANVRLVTAEEESLRRQHLQLLLFAARIAVMQQDRAAYVQSLRSADAWLAEFFDDRSAGVKSARTEAASLATIDIDPARPESGAAAQLLRRVYRSSPSKAP